jgi:cation:H+ antiporter
VLALDGGLTTTDGVILIVLVATHTVATVIAGRRHPEAVSGSDSAPDELPIPWCIGYLVVGLGTLVAGARLLVDGAVGIATAFGVSSLVIGLTVVAIGTSLPELAASMSAVRQGERDIVVGNVVGSNIFNIGLVLGVPAIISGGGLPVPASARSFDIPLMIATAVVLLPVALTGFEVRRWEGAMFVLLYGAYISYLVLAATDHDALDGFDTAMVAFVFPLVAVALAGSVIHEIRKRRRVANSNASPGGSRNQ